MLPEGDGIRQLRKSLDALHHNPGSIAKACHETREYIVQNKDNLRDFFQLLFPDLLKRIFGYDDFEASWLNTVTKQGREADARALKELLSPNGNLLLAMESADSVQFIFPIERLPAHTQELLKTPAGRKLLERWPQYAGRIVDLGAKQEVVVTVLEYFMFWTAFYVLRGSRSLEAPRGTEAAFGRSYMQGIKRMGSIGLHGRFGDQAGAHVHSHLYYAILREYLAAFLPQPGTPSHPSPLPPSRPPSAYSLNSYGMPWGGATSAFQPPPKAASCHGDVFLNVLMEFWLTDNAQPVPAEAHLPSDLQQGGALRHSPPSAAPVPLAASPMALRSVAYQPPSEELVEGLCCLFRHLNILQHPQKPPSPAQAAHLWLPPVAVVTSPAPQGRLSVPLSTSLLSSPSAGPQYQLVCRALYRFLRRAFFLWPQHMATPLTPVLHLWLTQVTPWAPAHPRTYPPASTPPRTSTSGAAPPPHPTPGSLERVHSLTNRLHLTRDTPRQGPPQETYTQEWRPHVLAALPFYSVLLPHFLELTYLRLNYKAEAALQDLLLLLRHLAACPTLLTELHAIEAALNRYLATTPRRAEGPYADLLPWLADQVVDWEHAATAGATSTSPMHADPAYRLFSLAGGDHPGAPYAARAIIDAARRMQGVSPDLVQAVEEAARQVLPIQLLAGATSEPLPDSQQLEASHFPKRGSWNRVAYKGSWLRRPVASYEVGVLVGPLVWLSERINAALQLDRPWAGAAEERPENILQEMAGYARRKGWYVDLRYLADRALLGWLLALLLALWVGRRLFSGGEELPPPPSLASPPVVAELDVDGLGE